MEAARALAAAVHCLLSCADRNLEVKCASECCNERETKVLDDIQRTVQAIKEKAALTPR